jgi:hypothetical protein
MPRYTSYATNGPASGHVGQLPASKAALPHPVKNIARVAMSASGNIRLISLCPCLGRHASAARMISPRHE